MKRALGLAATALFFSVAVIACGGGGGGISLGGGSSGTVTPPNNAGPNATATGGTAALSILIPAATTSSSTTRRPAYVSTATKSVAVFAYPATATPPPTATTLVNVGAGLPGCTAVTAGTSCTITVPAQYGSMTFVIKTYDNVLGTGNLLSQATLTQTIGPNQAAIPVTLGGVVAGVELSIPQYSYPAGGGSFTLTVNALDANGAVIVGGGTYNVPINIVTSDTADITISPSPVTGPGQPVTITYSATAPTGVTLRSHTPGLSSIAEGAVQFTVAQPTNTNYNAYVFDQNSGTVFTFRAGAVGQPNVISRYPVPGSLSDDDNVISVLPDGDFTVGPNYGLALAIFHSASATFLSLPSSDGGFAYDPSTGNPSSGRLAVLNEYPTASIGFYPANATSSSTPIPSLSIAGPALAQNAEGYPSMGIDATGNIYILQEANSVYQVVEIPADTYGSNVAAARTIPINVGTNGGAYALAVAPDGTIAVTVEVPAGPMYTYESTVQIFAPNTTTPSRTLTGGAIAASFNGGMAFAPDDTLYFAAGSIVSVYAPTATGTTPPERAFSTGLAGAGNLVGIGLGPAPATISTPAASSVSGDMLALAANRTWNYSGISADGPPTTLSLYQDPSPVDGNIGLVAFVVTGSVDNALPASGGTLAGAVGLADESDGYHGVSYGSVSNDSFGLVPGAPLLVPPTLTLGETFQPYPGITATVTGINTTSAAVQTACPGVTLQANVSYVIGGAGVGVLSYAPGCGITKFNNLAGASYTLQTVESHPEVGQQSFVRHVLNANYGNTLRTLWQHVLNGR